MINIDMIGRYDTSHKLTIGGFGTSPIWGEVLPNISSNLIIKYDSTGGGSSDHASFYRKDIPLRKHSQHRESGYEVLCC